MRKAINWQIFIFLFLMLNYCSPIKKSNIIGIYYNKNNNYNETEIFVNLEKIAFKNNFTIIKEGYNEKPALNIIKKFYKKGVKIIILEDYEGSDLYKFFKYIKKKDILLSLITDKKSPYASILNLTDYEQIGYDIAQELFNFTGSKRNTFIIIYDIKYSANYRKNELIKGYNRYFNKNSNLLLLTNTYSDTNRNQLEKTMRNLIYAYSSNLRGVLMDTDDTAVKIGKFLRNIRKEDEIKIAGFNALLNGIDSMINSGLLVTGDINRYALFHSAFTNSILNYSNIMNHNIYKTNVIPGVCYHQFNALDQLSYTRKFSIKQIIKAR